MQQSKANPLRDDAIVNLGKEIETIGSGFATASDFIGDRVDLAQMIDLQARLAAFKDKPLRMTPSVEPADAASLEDRRQISRFIGTMGDIARSLGSIVEAAIESTGISRRHNDRAVHHRRLAAN
jgi:hypothetical protein